MSPSFQSLVFILCLLTSAACAGLLVRSYLKSRARLLLWTAACFVLLSVNNLFLVVDTLVLPTVDLLPFRQFASLSAVTVLVVGFVWEAD